MPETDPSEVTDERIYEDLKAYNEAGMIDYVLPTDPIGEQWIVGWNGQILKFVTKEGIVGFLTGIQVCAQFAIDQRTLDPISRMQVEHCRRTVAKYREEHPPGTGKGIASTLAAQAGGLLEAIDGLAVREMPDDH